MKEKIKPVVWGFWILVLIVAIIWTVIGLIPPKPKKTIVSPRPAVQSLAPLPPYRILDRTDLISGGRDGDVLIKSFSMTTPRLTKERILRRIAEWEGFTSATLYCTMDAYKANFSSSFLKAHPKALIEGHLGSLRDGKFRVMSWER